MKATVKLFNRSDRGASAPSKILCLFLPALAGLGLIGCGGSGDSPTVTSAVEHLRRNESQKAIDALAKDQSPRALWLRAISLENEGQIEAARDQIQEARKLDPKNVEFQGLELRLDLYKPRIEAADEIIKLRDANRTSAPLALFTFYAYGAKAVYDQALNKEQTARAYEREALSALNSAIALNADIPEFHRELLSLAVKTQMGDQVDVLSENLHNAAPDDVSILGDRIAVLTMTHRYNEAVEATQKHYKLKKKSHEAAVLLANVLIRSSKSDEHDQMLEQLTRDHPDSITLIAQYAVYLARTERSGKAAEFFDKSIAAQKSPEERKTLITSMLSILLEIGSGKVARQKLEQYRDQIQDPLLVTYFEGRLLFLDKDYRGALEKMAKVIEGQKDAVGTNRPLALEAFTWVQVIMQDRHASGVMRATAAELQRRIQEGEDTAAIAEVPESAAQSPK